ncbi:MAG TPA: rhomboid family intramembrane serine protease [Paracoccus sp.]|nr:rhomboid family intramembrane serine protease [Paracoccus sp. (in: a-proteobacteria)]
MTAPLTALQKCTWVLGGYLLLFPRARIDVIAIFIIFFKIFTVPAWLVLGAWFALQVFGGFTVAGDGGGVAYWAHSGGFIAGIVLALPLFLRRGGPRFWSRHHGRPPHPAADYAPSRIPQVPRRFR